VARALQLDPELGAAYTVRGMNLWAFDQDWDAAGAAFERALELAPGDNFVRRWYANFLSIDGRCDEAIAQAKIHVAQSPLAFENKRELAGMLWNCRRLDEANAYIDEILPIFDGRFDEYLLWVTKLWWAIEKGDPDQIAVVADSCRTNAGRHAAPGLWLSGRQDEAWELVGGRDTERSDGSVAYLHLLEGDPDRVLAIIERWADEQPPYCMLMMQDPQYDPLREHPRWIAIAERFKLPGYR
jgi:tetratricopeptide (TPR) repeat protein